MGNRGGDAINNGDWWGDRRGVETIKGKSEIGEGVGRQVKGKSGRGGG